MALWSSDALLVCSNFHIMSTTSRINHTALQLQSNYSEKQRYMQELGGAGSFHSKGIINKIIVSCLDVGHHHLVLVNVLLSA